MPYTIYKLGWALEDGPGISSHFAQGTYLTHYPQGVRVENPTQPMFAFRDLSAASVAFQTTTGRDSTQVLQIWRGKASSFATVPYPFYIPATLAPQEWKRFWELYLANQLYKWRSVERGYAPRGTIFCPDITLLERVL